MVGGKEVTCALCRILTMSCLRMLWFCRENRKPEHRGRGYFVSQLSAIKAVQNMCALTNLNWSLEPRALVTPQMRDSLYLCQKLKRSRKMNLYWLSYGNFEVWFRAGLFFLSGIAYISVELMPNNVGVGDSSMYLDLLQSHMYLRSDLWPNYQKSVTLPESIPVCEASCGNTGLSSHGSYTGLWIYIEPNVRYSPTKFCALGNKFNGVRSMSNAGAPLIA